MIPVAPVKKDGKFYFLNCGDEGTMEVSEATYNAMIDSIREYNMKAQMVQEKRCGLPDRQEFIDGLSKNLREARKAAGLTQKQLAQKVGCAAHTLSQYENGTRMPNVRMISIISHELGTSLDDLIPYVPATTYKERSNMCQLTIFDVLY